MLPAGAENAAELTESLSMILILFQEVLPHLRAGLLHLLSTQLLASRRAARLGKCSNSCRRC
jgi:hypothetical protein